MSRRSNGEGSFYFNEARKMWEYKFPYIVEDKKKYKKLSGKTQKELKKRAAEFKMQIADDAASALTVKMWLERWLASCVHGYVRIKTEERYRLAVNRHIVPFIGNKALNNLTSMDIQEFLNALLSQGGEGGQPLSARTVNTARMVLSSALKCAVGDDIISKNPVMFTKPVKATRPAVRVLDVKECQKLVNSAHQEPNKSLWIAIVIALETGFRKGEVFGLKWSDVDFANQKISINRTCTTGNHGMTIENETKTKCSRRTVDITGSLVTKLQQFKDWQEYYLKSLGYYASYEGYIVTSEVGTVKDPNRYTSVSFKRILKRAGLPVTIRFHDLRHTHATQLLQAGVDIKSVSSRLGHSSIKITLDTYAHVMPSMNANVINRLDSLDLTGGCVG